MSIGHSIPGVYREPRPRAEGFPRVRTDVAGFVGAAGPRHVGKAVVVEDWKSYVAEFRQDDRKRPIEPPAGGALEMAVRDFFANGGRRLWIVNVAARIDAVSPQELLNDMLGIGHSLEAHGLELLLRQDDVSLVALPDLDAVQVSEGDGGEPVPLPGDPCFGRCGRRSSDSAIIAHRAGPKLTAERIFSNEDVKFAQRYLLERLEQESWRWFAVLAPPPGLQASAVVDWRQSLTRHMAPSNARTLLDIDEGSDQGALYWPWLIMQDSPGAPQSLRSPVGAITGLFAATDLAEGPQAAPANKPLFGVVGLETDVGDEENRIAYDVGVNVIRALPGRGIRVWGARTLLWQDQRSKGEPLAFVNARRCLSAISRSAWVVGQPLVFQPNTVMPRIRLHQTLTGYLLQVFASGALMGDRPEQGFFVQVEPAEESPEGQLVCRIGVALAAAAEFIVFRVGRESGVIETMEAA